MCILQLIHDTPNLAHMAWKRLIWCIFVVLELIIHSVAAAGLGLYQCTPPEPYDASFAGPQLRLAVEPLRNVSYHRFGPLRDPANNNGTEAPPLLLVMDFAANMYWWSAPTLIALAHHREVIIFDNPGVGNSTFPPAVEQLTIPQLSDHVVDFARALNLQSKPDLLGISMGAMVSLDIATRHGNAVRHVVSLGIMSGGPELPISEQWDPERLADIAQNATAILEYLFPKGLEDPGACAINATLDAFAHLGAREPVSREVLLKYAKGLVTAFCDNSTYAALPNVTNRLLFLHGQQDRADPVAAAVKAVSQVPGAWLVVLPEAGLGLPMASPQRFADIVDLFLIAAGTMTPEAAAYSHMGEKPQCGAEHSVIH
jgi:pimeloyl-ACP methyl ester carboxylesterase